MYRDDDSTSVWSGHSRRYRAYLSSEDGDGPVEPLIMPVRIVSVIVFFAKAVDANSYGLNYRSQRYGKKTTGLVKRDTKRMNQMMRLYSGHKAYKPDDAPLLIQRKGYNLRHHLPV